MLGVSGSDWKQLLVCWTYESGDATSAHGGLEVALQLLLDGASGVKALSQKDDGVDEEKGGDAVDDVLEDLDTEPMIQMLQTLQETDPHRSHMKIMKSPLLLSCLCQLVKLLKMQGVNQATIVSLRTISRVNC